jgi:hypothetical protein
MRATCRALCAALTVVTLLGIILAALPASAISAYTREQRREARMHRREAKMHRERARRLEARDRSLAAARQRRMARQQRRMARRDRRGGKVPFGYRIRR